jgi:hypothetical protein
MTLALPGDEAVAEKIAAFRAGKEEVAKPKPTKKYERILKTPPGFQWDDAGGYCGSWSIQRAAMAKGAWISQQQVRNHTVPGGGHDNEILATNIDLALSNLKLKAAGFDYKNLPTPQLDSGRKWMKQQLVAGNPLVQMIMLPGGTYPVYPNLPYGTYSHVEPIVGILSDKPLTDEEFYDDDYIVHYNDAGTAPLYRSMKSLPGKVQLGFARCPGNDGPLFGSQMCLHPEHVFSWAIQDFKDSKQGLPASLTVDQWKEEPDTRSGQKPIQLTGTVTIEGLHVGQKYALYRWDSVESAFDYSQPVSVYRFSASNVTEVYTDHKTFSSDGTTYYRCIVDSVVDSVVV